MSYPVTQLVTRAFNLSGILSRELETITFDQLNEGVTLLNALLAVMTADQRHIPYFTVYEFTLVSGQELYFIRNLVEMESLTFTIDEVRYSMMNQSKKNYFGSARVNNIQSLPFTWNIQRTLNGSNLRMYFLPNGNYGAEIVGKFSLASVALNQDLSLTLDTFYIEYLRYKLCEYLCDEYNISMQPQAYKKLREFEEVIMDIDSYDFSMQKVSSLQSQRGLNWADISIGHLWRP
jgi:hypothetical protein